MKGAPSYTLAAALATALLIVGWVVSSAQGQSADPQDAPKLTAEQQKQLEQLKQLEQKLQQDREAVHAAIADFGWDSDEADDTEAQLVRDREEYRKLRRALHSAGVAVPPPAGFGPRGGGPGYGFDSGPGPGPRYDRGYRRGGRGWHHGCRHHGPCCGW